MELPGKTCLQRLHLSNDLKEVRKLWISGGQQVQRPRGREELVLLEKQHSAKGGQSKKQG